MPAWPAPIAVGLVALTLLMMSGMRRRLMFVWIVAALAWYVVCRVIQPVWRSLSTGWPPVIIGLLLTGAGIFGLQWLLDHYWWLLGPQAQSMRPPPPLKGPLDGGIFTKIVLLYLLLLILWVRRRDEQRVIVEEFVDFTSEEGGAKVSAKGLATLLVAQMARMRDLYDDVDEQRAVEIDPGQHQPLNPTMHVDELSSSLKAISAEAKLQVGPFNIPVGSIWTVMSSIFPTLRISGSIHGNANAPVITAQCEGGRQRFTWRVDSSEWLTQPDAVGPRSIDDLIDELACRIFADLTLDGTVRWRAAWWFTCGLHEYRECLRSSRDRGQQLRSAENKFIKALSDDEEFALVYYDLGVVYTELGQRIAAAAAFDRAAARDPNLSAVPYALARNQFETLKDQEKPGAMFPAAGWKWRLGYEQIVLLCKRARRQHGSLMSRAKTWDLEGLVYHELAESGSPNQPGAGEKGLGQHQHDWRRAYNAHTHAALCAILALTPAVLRCGGPFDPFGEKCRRAHEIASACVRNLGKAHLNRCLIMPQEVLVAEQTARFIFRLAARLNPTSAACRLDIGRTWHKQGRLNAARKDYHRAIAINPEDASYRAYLAAALTDQTEFPAAWRAFLEACPTPNVDLLKMLGCLILDIRRLEGPHSRILGLVGEVESLMRDLHPRPTRQECLNRVATLKGSKRAWHRGVCWAVAGKAGFLSDADENAVSDFDRAFEELQEFPKTVARYDIAAQRARSLSSLLAQKLHGLADGDKAQLLKAQKDLKRSFEERKRSVFANPLGASNYHLLGGIYFELGDFEGGHKAVEAGFLWSPNNIAIRLNHANIHKQLAAQASNSADWTREMDIAVRIYQHTLAELDLHHPDMKARTHFRLARVLYDLNRMELAVTHFQQAEVLGPPGTTDIHWRACLGLAASLRACGRIDEATIQLARVIALLDQLEKDSLWFQSELVDSEIGAADEPMFRQELNVIAHTQLAHVHLDRCGDYGQAELEIYFAYERLRLPMPRDAQVRCQAACLEVEGRLRLAQGDVFNAIEKLKFAARLRGTLETYVWLATALNRNHEKNSDLRDVCGCIKSRDRAGRYKMLIEELLASEK